MRETIGKIGKTLEQSGVYIISCIGLFLGIGLTYYSAFYTEMCEWETGISRTLKDSVVLNVAVFLLIVTLFWLLHRGLKRSQEKISDIFVRLERVLLIIALLLSVTAGGVWVAVSHVEPYADARSVCVVAECVLAGDFPMQPPTYMGFCPHQYGIVFVLHCLFALFGSGNYAAWQYMNVLFFPLLIFAGYRIVKLIYENSEVGILYLFLVIGYLPLYFYLPYVYGDFASASCGMVVMWQTIVFCKKENYSAIGWGTLAAVFGCLVRKNTWIVVIAAVLVLLLCSLSRTRFRLFLMALIMPLSIWCAERGVQIYYEHLSGQQISPGIPSVCYVMMGLEDGEEGPGWFNGSNYRAYISTDYDYEAAERYGREQVGIRLQELWRNKTYAMDFFRRKIVTQWNMPDCYSINETMHFDCEETELPMVVQWIYFDEGRDRLEDLMNRCQFVIYAGFVFTVLGLGRSDRRKIENYILLIAIVGGFLFSILWEAMSRYVLSYVVYMIPLAAVGIWQLRELLASSLERIRKTMPQRDR